MLTGLAAMNEVTRSGAYMKQETRKLELEAIADKVKILRHCTKETGFITTRSVGQLMANLTADEIVIVCTLAGITPPEMRR